MLGRRVKILSVQAAFFKLRVPGNVGQGGFCQPINCFTNFFCAEKSLLSIEVWLYNVPHIFCRVKPQNFYKNVGTHKN